MGYGSDRSCLEGEGGRRRYFLDKIEEQDAASNRLVSAIQNKSAGAGIEVAADSEVAGKINVIAGRVESGTRYCHQIAVNVGISGKNIGFGAGYLQIVIAGSGQVDVAG